MCVYRLLNWWKAWQMNIVRKWKVVQEIISHRKYTRYFVFFHTGVKRIIRYRSIMYAVTGTRRTTRNRDLIFRVKEKLKNRAAKKKLFNFSWCFLWLQSSKMYVNKKNRENFFGAFFFQLEVNVTEEKMCVREWKIKNNRSR
jgi:hypothetical protein